MRDMAEKLVDEWRARKQARQEKRSLNRECSTALLAEKGVPFESRQGGVHLVVRFHDYTVDFWPATGIWIDRRSRIKRRGVKNMLSFLGHRDFPPASAQLDAESCDAGE